MELVETRHGVKAPRVRVPLEPGASAATVERVYHLAVREFMVRLAHNWDLAATLRGASREERSKIASLRDRFLTVWEAHWDLLNECLDAAPLTAQPSQDTGTPLRLP